MKIRETETETEIEFQYYSLSLSDNLHYKKGIITTNPFEKNEHSKSKKIIIQLKHNRVQTLLMTKFFLPN